MNCDENDFPAKCAEYLQRFATNSEESVAVHRLADALRTSPYTNYHHMQGISYGEWMRAAYESYYLSSASLPQLCMYGIWESRCADMAQLAWAAIHSWVRLCETTGNKFQGRNRIWNQDGSETTRLPVKNGTSVLLNRGASVFFNSPPDDETLAEAMKASGSFSGLWTWKVRDERRRAEEILRQHSARNARNLQQMREAGLVVCIDERSPATIEEAMTCLCSPHASRWFPNALQYIIFQSGLSVVCLDHLSFIGGDIDPLIHAWKEAMTDSARLRDSEQCDCAEFLEWDAVSSEFGADIGTAIRQTHLRYIAAEFPEKLYASRLTRFFANALRRIYGDPVPIFSIGCSLEHLGEKLDFAFLIPAEVSRLLDHPADFDAMVRKELSIVKHGGGIYARLYAISCLDEHIQEICQNPFLRSFLVVANYMTVVRAEAQFAFTTLKPDDEEGTYAYFWVYDNNTLNCTLTGFSEDHIDTIYRVMTECIKSELQR